MAKRSKTKRFTTSERRAYWIGVGISAALHGDSEALLNAPNKRLSQSAVNGYVQDNKKDISRKVFYSKTNKN